MKKIAIIGSGSWGSALAIYLGNKGENVCIWSFAEEEKELINTYHKCKFLPEAVIPESVTCTTDAKEAVENAEIILHVTPSKFVRSTIQKYKDFVSKDQILVMCSKGFESETLKSLDEVIEEELPGIKYGVLSGPSHAEEVSKGIPTALVIASKENDVIDKVSNVFKSNIMRIYHTDDVKGAELGRCFKKYNSFLCRYICWFKFRR